VGNALDAAADASYFGTLMVYHGQADGMVSVQFTPPRTRFGLHSRSYGPDGISIVSSVFFMCLPDRVLVFGDCAVNPNPNPSNWRT